MRLESRLSRLAADGDQTAWQSAAEGAAADKRRIEARASALERDKQVRCHFRGGGGGGLYPPPGGAVSPHPHTQRVCLGCYDVAGTGGARGRTDGGTGGGKLARSPRDSCCQRLRGTITPPRWLLASCQCDMYWAWGGGGGEQFPLPLLLYNRRVFSRWRVSGLDWMQSWCCSSEEIKDPHTSPGHPKPFPKPTGGVVFIPTFKFKRYPPPAAQHRA